jgi:hypothetical protein
VEQATEIDDDDSDDDDDDGTIENNDDGHDQQNRKQHNEFGSGGLFMAGEGGMSLAFKSRKKSLQKMMIIIFVTRRQ